MGKTFILGNSPKLNEIGFNVININSFENEIEVHDFVINLFETKEIEKLVIEISDKPIISIQIGYHVRLSLEQLKNRVLTPILFISSQSLNQILINTRGFSHILSTVGTRFCDFDFETIKREIEYLEILKETEYLTGFLKQVNILPDETIGRHSLANIWGAYAMDNAANIRVLDKNADFKKSLYFKFVVATNNLSLLKGTIENGTMQNVKNEIFNIEARDKKILYIDDEANKGWEIVLKKIFHTSREEDFVVINEKILDYESLSQNSKDIIENQRFDLYLVDLRLNGLDEDENIKTEEFSGMKILQKIKSINKGNQVIIFTASNKTWNLNSLLDQGADGYYLKESPEFNIPINQTINNLKNLQLQVKGCFNRSDYLRRLYSLSNGISVHFVNNRELTKNTLTGNVEVIKSQFEIDIMNQINIACALLERTNHQERIGRGEFQNLVNHAFISIYKIIEYFFYEKIDGGKVTIKCYDSRNRRFKPYENKGSKIRCGLLTYLSEYLQFDPFSYYFKLENFGELRNNVSHPGSKQPSSLQCVELLETLNKILIQIK